MNHRWTRKIALSGSALVVALGLVLGGIAPANAATAPKISIKLTRVGSSQTVTGDNVSFSGTVSPQLRGRKITLQRMDQGKSAWVSVGAATVSSKATFSVKGKAAGMGANKWRAVYTGTFSYKSATLSTTVSKWLYLDDLDAVSHDLYDFTTANVGGKTYTKGLTGGVWWGEGTSVYNLSYKCSSFISGIGLDNTTSSGAKALFFTDLDGAEKVWASAIGVGNGRAIQLDTRGAFRLTVGARPVAGNPTVVFGNARILCSGMP
ncbi:NPCBM/NEW2 domain-containing protein [Cryobacterium sp. SO2]|uniref:NPCBM/NEW2 domain-containing protein n=1 Tax=Cryobacterium sp. SO2 TaxID=1897060 RepID=UPI00223E5A65|nr:NPCBM/NEW2 domain-containing protein [Cryobacterium sp. SO2]WEO76779.1 NPCBM/NEW2 domain-containing protein [Cryobacterium sp. SO2]